MLLQGLTKSLLYRDIEREAIHLLGDDLVRMHATPVTNVDPYAQRQLLDQTTKV